MRLKASRAQKIAMSIFMVAVLLWSGLHDWRLIGLSLLFGIALVLYPGFLIRR